MDANQATNTRLQGEIQTLLNPAPMSREAQFSSWLGSMAEILHPSLTQRYYMESFQLMMGLQDESRQLFAAAQQRPTLPNLVQVAPPTQTFVQVQQQPPTNTYVPIQVPDVPDVPGVPDAPNPYNMDPNMIQDQHVRLNNWQQQRQETEQQRPPRMQSAATPSWDTAEPAAGHVFARPSSTPPAMMDGSLNISQLNFSQSSGSYSFTDLMRHQDIDSGPQDLSTPTHELHVLTPPHVKDT